MSGFVIDASALLYAVTDPSPAGRRLLRNLQSGTAHAPYLIDAEVGSAVRRKVLRREMAIERAVTLMTTCPALIDHRHEHHGWLTALAWSLRENVGFYDALYVALAAALGLELVTLDTRLAGAPDLPASVRLAAR